MKARWIHLIVSLSLLMQMSVPIIAKAAALIEKTTRQTSLTSVSVTNTGLPLTSVSPSTHRVNFQIGLLEPINVTGAYVPEPLGEMVSEILTSSDLVWDFGENSGQRHGWDTNGWECEGFYGWNFWVLDPELNGDPWIVKNDLYLDNTKYWAVQIRMLSRADSGDNIFWKTSNSNYYSGDKSRPLNVIADEVWHIYTIRVNNHSKWMDYITGLRIDPAYNGRAGTCGTDADNIYIDWVKLLYDDAPPSNPTSFSSSHSSNWSQDNTVYVSWSGASDAHSGVAGYSFQWSTSPTTLPDTTMDTTGLSTTSPALADGIWYFHIRTVDNAGKWAAGAAHYGPFKIDRTPPSNPTAFNATPPINQWTNDNTITISWSGASDARSGVRGYSYEWSTSSTTLPNTTMNPNGSSTTSPELADGNWYFHIRTLDWAGNWNSGAAHYGPFRVDATAPSGSITSPAANASIGNSVTIQVNASDSRSGVNRVVFRATYDGVPHKLATDTSAPYAYTWNTSGVSNQCISLDAVVYDNAGNQYDTADVIVRKGVDTCGLVLSEGLTLTPARITEGQTTQARYVVRNHSATYTYTVKLRAKTDQGTCTFGETNNVTIFPSGEQIYQRNATCFSPGVYEVTAQYLDGTWKTLLGDATEFLQVLAPPPPPEKEISGQPPQCGTAGEPVNTATGNFYQSHTDFTIPGPGRSFSLARNYNALDAADVNGPFGFGRTFSFGPWLDWRVDDSVIITHPDGHVSYFIGNLDGTYEPDAGVKDTLLRNLDDSFDLTAPDQTRYHFSSTGTLLSIATEHGHQQQFNYSDGKLVSAVDTAGNTYNFVYAGTLITKITSSIGLTYTYAYANGDLVSVTNTAGETMTYTYDLNHRLVAAADATGRVYVTNFYDDQGRVIAQTDADGNAWTFDYDDATRTVTVDEPGRFVIHTYNEHYQLVREEDAFGRTITYTWDLDHNLLATKDKNGAITHYTYDERGNRLSRTDALGYTWLYTYDEQNRLLSETDPLGYTTHYSYDAEGHLTSVTDALGHTTTYEYGPQGLPIRVTDANGHVTERAYNALGLTVAITDALGNVTWMDYDAFGNLITYTDAAGQTATYLYDSQGRPMQLTDPRGYTTTYTYHPNGQLATKTNALGYTQVYTYDENTRLTHKTDWAGNVSMTSYDVAGRPVIETDPLGHTLTFTYDAVGNLITRIDQRGFATHYIYDPARRLLVETDPLSGTTTYAYDAVGRVISVADTLGNVTQTQYDERGNIVAEIDAQGSMTSYTYDALGRVTVITDALGYATTTAYDPVGNILSRTDALGHTWHYGYDALNRVITTTNPLGYHQLTYFDAVGRVISATDTRGFTTHYAYDAGDNLLQVTDPLSGTTSYAYDALSRRITEINPLGYVITTTYDANGNVTAQTDALGHTAYYSYDALGRQIEILDALGGRALSLYDAAGNLVSYTDMAGRITQYTYDALGRRESVTDPRGGVTYTGYDLLGRVITHTDALGFAWLYAYDANGNRTMQTDPLGNVTYTAYDALNREIETTNALGGVRRYSYDAFGHVIELSEPGDRHTVYTYDALGQLLTIRDAGGYTTTYAYDEAGNQVALTDRNSYTTWYDYDALNRRIRITDPFSGVTQLEYDARGHLIASTDALNRTTTRIYDANGQLTHEIDPAGSVMTTTYDALSRRTAATDPNGYTTHYGYDPVGQIISVTLSGGQTTTYAYDTGGNRVQEINALGQATTWGYDLRNQRITITDALGNVTSSEYDALGRKISDIDAAGNTTLFEYDALGRLARLENALKHSTHYLYDPAGNLIYKQDANHHVWRYSYDKRDLLIRETNPLGKTWYYHYDGAGNLIARRAADGALTRYSYDALGRLTQTAYPDGNSVEFAYDAVGNRIVMTDSVGVSTYTYDAGNRMLGSTTPISGTVNYTYDAAGQRTAIVYPGGERVAYGYDANGWLVSVTDPLNGMTTYTRDATGAVETLRYPNNALLHYRYDAAGRLVGLENRDAGGVIFAAYTYTLDPLGNRVQTVETTDTVITHTYTYDALGQLVHSAASNGTINTYTYDLVGNRLLLEIWVDGQPNTTLHYTYNAANQLLAVNQNGNITRYTYDANGNRVTQESPMTRATYTFDADNRLIEARVYTHTVEGWMLREGMRETYTYDGLGRRVIKTAWITETAQMLARTSYLYDAYWGVLQEGTEIGGEKTTALFTYGEWMDRLSFYTAAGNYHPFHTDGLGSVIGHTNAQGQLATPGNLASYSDFGELSGNVSALLSDYAYTGHERESYTGLFYAKYRFYDPVAGLWLSPDPAVGNLADPLTQHRYAYVGNNPINDFDPLGQFSWGGLMRGITNKARQVVQTVKRVVHQVQQQHPPQPVQPQPRLQPSPVNNLIQGAGNLARTIVDQVQQATPSSSPLPLSPSSQVQAPTSGEHVQSTRQRLDTFYTEKLMCGSPFLDEIAKRLHNNTPWSLIDVLLVVGQNVVESAKPISEETANTIAFLQVGLTLREEGIEEGAKALNSAVWNAFGSGVGGVIGAKVCAFTVFGIKVCAASGAILGGYLFESVGNMAWNVSTGIVNMVWNVGTGIGNVTFRYIVDPLLGEYKEKSMFDICVYELGHSTWKCGDLFGYPDSEMVSLEQQRNRLCNVNNFSGSAEISGLAGSCMTDYPSLQGNNSNGSLGSSLLTVRDPINYP